MTRSASTVAPQGFLALAVLLALLGVAYAADYCHICSDHTMCKYLGVSSNCLAGVSASGVSLAEKEMIGNLHNKYRNKVASGSETRGNSGPQPSAANMQRLSWDDELAAIAQRWVDQCDYRHDSCRNVDRFYVGQNLALTASSPCSSTSDKKADWDKAVQMWYSEVDNMDRSKVSSFSSGGPTVGHYTQLVWATTTKVGCGFRLFQDGAWCRKYYACNYGEGGNWISSPVYVEGTPRTKCASSGPVDPAFPALC